jgi:hypothetical protein
MAIVQPEQMKPGRKYLLIHQIPGQRFPRRSVLKFLRRTMEERVLRHRSEQEYIFDFRPKGGDQKFPRSYIISIREVPPETIMYMNRDGRT